MNHVIGNFRIGEDLAVALDAADGDPAEVIGLVAGMKPAKAVANRLVLDDAAPGISLAVAARGGEGWTLSLAAAVTSALEPGLYGIDARLSLAGGTEITEQTAFIALTRAAVA